MLDKKGLGDVVNDEALARLLGLSSLNDEDEEEDEDSDVAADEGKADADLGDDVVSLGSSSSDAGDGADDEEKGVNEDGLNAALAGFTTSDDGDGASDAGADDSVVDPGFGDLSEILKRGGIV
jgi:midasin (ATPase involved in ribosome maturation)